jgi:hypothetical protein
MKIVSGFNRFLAGDGLLAPIPRSALPEKDRAFTVIWQTLPMADFSSDVTGFLL